MPVLWRHLLSDFLRISLTCIFAFIAILLTMQLDDIAHFAALGAPFHYILLFTLHQIPYILPIALPLSCLIASYILAHRLSNTHELTVLRASGFSLGNVFVPIWLTAALLSVGNFWIVSEIATRSHLKSSLLKSELRSINPLLLLNSKHLMRLKGFYFEAFGPSRVGETASDVVLALPGQHHERLHLMFAKNLKSNSHIFEGEEVTLVTGIASEQEDEFDQLLIENMKRSLTNVSDFSDMLQKKVSVIHNDYLQLPLLLERIREQRRLLDDAQEKNLSKDQLKSFRNQLNRSYSEISKRISMAFAVFSFTLMGTSLGIHIGRKKNHRSLYYAIALTTLYLIAFFIAKEAGHQRGLPISLYFIPQLLIIILSISMLRKVTRGIE